MSSVTLKGGYSYLEELLDFGPEATVSGTPELAIVAGGSSRVVMSAVSSLDPLRVISHGTIYPHL